MICVAMNAWMVFRNAAMRTAIRLTLTALNYAAREGAKPIAAAMGNVLRDQSAAEAVMNARPAAKMVFVGVARGGATQGTGILTVETRHARKVAAVVERSLEAALTMTNAVSAAYQQIHSAAAGVSNAQRIPIAHHLYALEEPAVPRERIGMQSADAAGTLPESVV